jgi:hypothetical protein
MFAPITIGIAAVAGRIVCRTRRMPSPVVMNAEKNNLQVSLVTRIPVLIVYGTAAVEVLEGWVPSPPCTSDRRTVIVPDLTPTEFDVNVAEIVHVALVASVAPHGGTESIEHAAQYEDGRRP